MATIVPIDNVDAFFKDERIAYQKMISVLGESITTLISTQNSISSELDTMLYGVSGGIDQAVLLMTMASAPSGWTRDIGYTEGAVLRVTDGSTAPPGDSPSHTGGNEGGSWVISGVTVDNVSNHNHGITHIHTLSNHNHGSTHFHTMNNHTHASDDHTHTITPESTTIGNMTDANPDKYEYPTGSYYGYSKTVHTHTPGLNTHSHGGTTLGVLGSPTTTAVSTNNTQDSTFQSGSPTVDSGASSVSTSSDNGEHNHTLNTSSSWRPKYVTAIVCSKD